MCTLAIRETERLALTPLQRVFLGCCTSLIVPGEAACYLDEEGVEWGVFDDHRVPLEDVALGGSVMAGISTIQIDPTGLTKEEIRQFLLDATQGVRINPSQVDLNEGEDSVAAVWQAQNPPQWARMTSSVPSGWSPRTEEGSP